MRPIPAVQPSPLPEPMQGPYGDCWGDPSDYRYCAPPPRMDAIELLAKQNYVLTVYEKPEPSMEEPRPFSPILHCGPISPEQFHISHGEC